MREGFPCLCRFDLAKRCRENTGLLSSCEAACHGQQACGMPRSFTRQLKPCLHRKRLPCEGCAQTGARFRAFLVD